MEVERCWSPVAGTRCRALGSRHTDIACLCPSAGCQEPCGHIQHRPDHTSTQEGAGGTNMSQAEGTAEPLVCPGGGTGFAWGP